jgi:membrane associated rhomboid family serine protease
MEINVTIIIVAITVIVSILALRDERLERKLIFNPYIIHRRREYWRFLSAALIHGNYLHLGLNMFVLYQFGSSIEKQFDVVYGNNKWLEALYYLGLYIPGAILSGFYSFEKNKNNIHYNALGASGAVSAVVFAYIGVVPTQNFWLLGALPVPAFAYGILFLIVSWVMARKGQDNIGHDAHFFGALYGIMYIFIIQPSQLPRFFESINYYIQHLF